MTPEGRVKQRIRAVLNKYAEHLYVHMPVPGGYGRSALDYIGFCCGLGFAIEAKRQGGKPNDRQLGVIEEMQRAGGKVFVIDGPPGLQELDEWITTVVEARGSR